VHRAGCGVARRLRRGERWSGRCARAAGVRGAVCGAWRAGGSGSSARPDLSAVETKSAGQKRQCGDRSSRNRRAASGRGAARRCQCRFGCERCPPTRAACRRVLSLTPRQYGGAPACRRPSWAATLTVRRSGVSRDGPEGVPNERTAPQTAWEPRRPPRWRRLPAALARSTKRAFSWRPLGPCNPVYSSVLTAPRIWDPQYTSYDINTSPSMAACSQSQSLINSHLFALRRLVRAGHGGTFFGSAHGHLCQRQPRFPPQRP